MKKFHGPLKVDGSGFRWLAPHVDLFNQVWHDDALSPGGMPGASEREAAAFAAGLATIGKLDVTESGVLLCSTVLTPAGATRVVALLVELARRYPVVLGYPGRLEEVSWPVLSEAYRQRVLRGPEDLAELQRIVDRAAEAVSGALRGPSQQWWQPLQGRWLWASKTRSLTTGREIRPSTAAPALTNR